ncbi:hypothetical protein QQX98_005644 [Neonectria punicea]|uniref:Lysine-specific metallo-endopeptidase domain-containing protein n=1 Tax=Neonectria punicea TaxID=979145 RepID=A0ABR1H3U5_9HYPO
MRFSFLVGLLAGLSQAVNLYDTWEVDKHCRGKGATLEKAYIDSALMADKALLDLQKIQRPRPRTTRSNIPEIREWDRVARAVTNMFGFVPNQAGHSPINDPLADVLYVFNRMNESLNGPHNLPVNGYAGVYYKPLIMCGPDQWRWIAKDDKDPNDPAHTLLESKGDLLKGGSGAWVYGTRYISNGDPTHVGPCRSPATYAVTMTRWDLLTFCDLSFSAVALADIKSLVDHKKNFKVGDKLGSFAQNSLQRVMVHEFAHYYGADGFGTPDDRKVDDMQAVSKDGDLVWIGADGKFTTQQPGEDEDLASTASYGHVRITRLARSHTGDNADNSGPDKATFNAESFAYFAIMAYLDNFDWTDGGKAKEIATS